MRLKRHRDGFIHAIRIPAILIGILISCFLMPVFVTGDSSGADRSIRVVIDNNYPPYTFVDGDGNLQGISIDLWHLFEKRTGIRVTVDGMDWSAAQAEMEAGRADVIDTMFFNPERDLLYDFSRPYAKVDTCIFFDRNISGISGVESLKGFTVATKDGDHAVSELQAAGVADIRLYQSYEEIVLAARERKITVFVIDKPPGLFFLYKYNLQDMFGFSDPLYGGEFHRAVRQGEGELLHLLEDGFEKISDKESQNLVLKWTGNTDIGFGWVRYVPLYAIGALSFALLLLAWNGMLRKKVAEKTHELAANLSESEKREDDMRGMLEAIPDLYFVLDAQGVFLDYHGPQNNENLLTEPAAFLGHSLREFFPPALSDRFMDVIRQVSEQSELRTLEYSLEIDGVAHHYEARLSAGRPGSVVGIVRDITERKESELKLQLMSTHDTLTGLRNRYYFEKTMAELQKARPAGLGVAMCDLDGLKLVNDSLGHERGDEYLKTVAGRINSAFPAHATVARIGGDEFGVLVPDVTEEAFMQSVLLLTHELPEYLSQTINMPVSISVGSFHETGPDLNVVEMLMEADRRMYREKLHRKQSIRHEMIQTLRKMLEVRDFITEGHAERMEDQIVRLAEIMSVPMREFPDLRLFAQFHDIGKIGVPDSILYKPGRLTAEEYESMKRHTEIGYHIALSSVDLMPISDWVLKHHEHWDGGGYPLGLSGGDIPLECRLLAVVDAYDAMTNDRPYRLAMTKPEALMELGRHAGGQFDPRVVENFLILMEE